MFVHPTEKVPRVSKEEYLLPRQGASRGHQRGSDSAEFHLPELACC